jgi:uncharacterized repeat protein (TIGR01451 family)
MWRSAEAPFGTTTGSHWGRSLRLTLTGVAVGLLVLAPGLDAATTTKPADGALLDGAGASTDAVLPASFTEDILYAGQLTNPAAVRFTADGRVFVAQKNGVIKVFDSLADTSPDTFADLSANVHNFWDRGMLGFAIDPAFTTTRPYVYVLYTYDAPIGGSPPTWGDGCPTPPGATADGCVVSARLSRLTANGNVMTGSELVLVNDWCQQYPSHSIGSLAFGADGMLYVSGGDGASFNFTDYGQDGTPLNPCGDPPGGVGATLTPPTAEGGALRSQDLRTTADSTSLDGSILRLNPDTGAAAAGNPLIGSSDVNARRIIAHGLRNPFRFTIRPGTNEVWLGDVGWNTWEEINRITDPLGTVENFGWPCYEGNATQSGYDSANLSICENLYAAGGVIAPYYTYNHSAQVVAGETCPTGGSSIAGLAFYQGGTYPAAYTGALFFADYSRDCIWVMFAGGNGLPNAANRATFAAAASNPVDLQIGPGGDLFYADFDGGSIRRIRYVGAPPPPPTPGLVAAYSFDEGNGANVADASGTGNTGAIGTAAWTTQGKFGGALSFNGSNARVTVNDAASLHLTTGMTLEAWVFPTAASTSWKDLIYKGNDNYYLSASSCCQGRPAGGGIFSGSYAEVFGTSNLGLNTWTHLATTYDGATLRLYVNGTQVSSTARTGTLATSTNPLTIGGDPIYGQHFAGTIDEVRVYNAALTQAQISTDMATAIGGGSPPPPDGQPPSDPSNLSATPVSQSQIDLSWTASTDNVGVTGYRLERCQGTSCTNFVEVATPAGSPHSDTGLTAGATYRYRVRAADAAGNLSGYSNIATATTQGAANTAPTATISTPANLTTWKVGDTISFSGSATDAEDVNVATSGLSWTLVQQHCPSGQSCHSHTVQTFNGVASGSFVAPDHEYPSYLELTLTATDSGGLTDTETVRLDPLTVVLTFQSSPAGLQLTVGSTSGATPFTRTVIQGSTNSVSAPTPQSLNGTSYSFASWSDGGAATHSVVANAAATYTATYQAAASADLRLLKTGAASGTTATWTLAVTNLGPSTAQNVVVTDTLPSRLTFVSAPGCVYTSATRVLTCSLASLAGGGNASFTVTTTITGNGGGWITNTAQVTSATADPVSANNTSSDRVRAR